MVNRCRMLKNPEILVYCEDNQGWEAPVGKGKTAKEARKAALKAMKNHGYKACTIKTVYGYCREEKK